MSTQLPHITKKQQEILKLVHSYRFINRIQVQILLRHKDKRRVIEWLKDLREKQYLDWHYDSKDLKSKSTPAVYYIALNGIRYLRNSGDVNTHEIQNLYKESARKQSFIHRCLLIADCCIALQAKSMGNFRYSSLLPANYAHSGSGSQQYFLNELKPHLFFAKRNGSETIHYVLEYFEANLPRYRIRQRVKNYVDCIDAWEDSDGAAPIGLFVCANTADLVYVKRRTKDQLEEIGSDEIAVRVTTLEKVKATGIVSEIWENV